MEIVVVISVLAGVATVIALGFQIKQYFEQRQSLTKPNLLPNANPQLGESFRRYFASVLERPYFHLPDQAALIEKVKSQLRFSAQVPIIILCGAGGLGKTTIAAQVVKHASELGFLKPLGDSAKRVAFEELQNKVIDSPARLEWDELIDTLVRQLGSVAILSKSREEKKQWIKKQLQIESYLVLIDNLETVDNARELLGHLRELLVGTDSRALATYRYADLSNLSGTSSIGVVNLSDSDSRLFLLNELRMRGFTTIEEWLKEKDDDETSLNQVLDLTRGLPLAIQLVIGLRFSLPLASVSSLIKEVKTDARVEELYEFLYRAEILRLSKKARKLLFAIFSKESGMYHSEIVKVFDPQPETVLAELGQFSLVYSIRKQKYNSEAEDYYYVHPMLSQMLSKINSEERANGRT